MNTSYALCKIKFSQFHINLLFQNFPTSFNFNLEIIVPTSFILILEMNDSYFSLRNQPLHIYHYFVMEILWSRPF